VEFDETNPKIIKSDRQRLLQLLRIFAQNARLYTAKGVIKVKVSYNAPSKYLEVAFWDTGVGIPKKHHS
jgi:signal transduction histidine kinase